MPAGLKQRSSSKDKNYYANQVGRTAANKARRARRIARRKVSIPQPRVMPPTARACRRAAATRAHLKAHHAAGAAPVAPGVNDNVPSAQASSPSKPILAEVK